LFIYTFIDGYLSSFYILAIVNIAMDYGTVYILEALLQLFWIYTWKWECWIM
jgi:hypothetical protein